MSRYLVRERIARHAKILPAIEVAPQPALPEVDRSFEMPRALYGAMVAAFLGFIGVLGIGLQSPGLVIPMAIFAFFIIAGFGVPAIWTRLAPDSGQKAMTVEQLMRRGIATHTGRCEGLDAAVQMLVLPVLILGWAIAIVIIAATV